MEYLFLFCFFFWGWKYFKTTRTINSHVYYYLECFFLILLWGLRYRVGGDSLRYEDYFYLLPSIDEIENFDYSISRIQPFWLYYNACIKYIYNDFIFFQFVHSFIINISIFYYIDKHCTNRFLASLLYYSLFSPYYNTEILREVLSIIIFLYSIDYLLVGKYLKYYLFSIIAFLFHISAFVLFILPLLLIFYNEKKSITQFVFCSVAFFVLSFTIFYFISPELFGSMLSYEYMNSLNKIYKGEGLSNINGIIGQIIQMSYVYLLTVVLILSEQHNKAKVLFLFSLLTCFCIQFPVLMRLYNYFLIFSIIYSSDLLINITLKKRLKRYVKLALFILIIFRIHYYTKEVSQDMTGGVEHYRFYNIWYPYHSILDPETEVMRERLLQYQFD